MPIRIPQLARPRRKLRAWPALFAGLMLGTTLTGRAATFTWDGGSGTDSLWGTAANWNPDAAPSTGAIDTDLVFNNSIRLANSIGPLDFKVSDLAFGAGAGAFIISGDAGKKLIFEEAAGSITNSSLSLQTITVSFIDIKNAMTIGGSGNISISSVLQDAGSLTKTGAGTVILGGNNTFSGGTNISAGTLQISASNRLLDAGALTVSGGTFNLATFSETVGLVTLASGSITGTGVLTGSSYAVQSGAVSAILGGAGGLTKTTASTVTLSGVNTYTGATTVNAGTLQSSANNVLPGTAVTVSGTGAGIMATLDLNSFSDTIGSLTLGGSTTTSGSALTTGTGTLTLGGNVTYSATNNPLGATIAGNLGLGANRTFTIGNSTSATVDLSVSAVVSGAFTLTKAGTGTLALSGTNTFSGTTTVSAGTLRISNNAALGTTGSGTTVNAGGALELTGNVAVGAEVLTLTGAGIANGGALRNVSGNNSWAGGIVLADVAGLVRINADTGTALTISGGFTEPGTNNKVLTFGGAGNVTINGMIAGANNIGLTKDGAGTLTLANANTYTRATTLSGGVTLLNNANALSGGIGATGGATALTMNGGIVGLGAGNFSRGLGTNADQVQFTGSGGFAAFGADRTVNLGGAAAQVTWANGSFIPTGSALILGASGATNTVTFQNPIAFNAALRTVQVDNGSAAVDAILSGVLSSGSGGLTKTGAGTLTLSGTAANTYAGATTVTDGTLQLGKTSGLNAFAGSLTVGDGAGSANTAATRWLATNEAPNASAISVNTDGWLDLNNFSDTVGALTMTGGSVTTGAGTLTLGGNVTGNVSAASATITGNLGLGANRTFTIAEGAAPVDMNISALISGAFTLTKAGLGTMVLSGANTYTGLTTVSAGVMDIQHATGLGTTAGGTTVTAGAALQLQGGIAVGAEALTLNGAGVATNGALRNISGTNSYAGAITLGSASTIASDAGTLTLSGGIVNGGFASTFTGAGAMVESGVISGTGALTKTGLGTLTLSGTNSYSGGTTINGGTVVINTNASLGAAAVAATINAGTLEVAGTFSAARNFTLGNAASTILVDPTHTFTVGTILSGAGALNKSGTGTLVLTGANTYTGGTFLNAGTTVINADARLGVGGTTTINAAALQIATGFTTARAFSLGNAASTLQVDPSQTFTIASAIGGTGKLNKTGAGALVLAGANTYTGGSTIDAGTVVIHSAASLGATTNALLINAGTLEVATGFAGTRNIVLGSAASTLQVNAGQTYASSGTLSGTGALTKTGTGTLTLSGSNSYSGGTTINAGILSIDDPAGLGAASGVLTINATGTYRATNSFSTSRAAILGGTGGAASGGTFDITGANIETRTGIISGAGSLTKTGTGALLLTGINTFTGDTYISGGTLGVSNNEALGPQPTLGSALYAVHMAGGTTMQTVVASESTNRQLELISGTATLDVTNGFTQQRNGLVYGAGGLIKAGTGLQILTNANTYSGGTTINSGTLQVNNATGSATGSGTVVVNSGGILSGLPTAIGFASPGSISGAVTVNGGGKLLAQSGGTLTLGSLTLNTAAFSDFRLGSLTATSMVNITATDGLSLAGVSTVNLNNLGGLGVGTYRLFDYTGTALTDLSNLQLGSAPGGFTFSLSNNQSNTSIDLLVSPVGNQWANDASGTWSTTSNWTNGIPPNAVGAQANFLSVINQARTVTVDGAFTAGTFAFDNASAYTIAGDGVGGHGVTLDNTGSTAFIDALSGSHTISAPLALADHLEITADPGAALILSGAISETNAGRTVLSDGAGTATFSGTAANTYTGRTTVTVGTLNLGKSAGVDAIATGGIEITFGANAALLASHQIADTATATVNGTFTLGTFSETIGALSGIGSVTLGTGSVLTIGAGNNLSATFDGVISGAGTLTKAGAGTFTLEGANTFGGAGQTVTISGGTLEIAADDNLGNSANTVTFNGGALFFANSFASARGVILSGDGSVETNDDAVTLSGVISGAGALTKNGTGTLTLSGSNTFGGGTFITGGNSSAVRVASAANLGSGPVHISDGASLATTADFTRANGIVLGAIGGGNQGDVQPISGALNIADGTTLTISGTGISESTPGTGRLAKLGAGTLILATPSSYSAGTYLHEGILQIATLSALGPQPFNDSTFNTLTIDNGAELRLTTDIVTRRDMLLGNGGGVLGATTSANIAYRNGIFSNVASQSGGLTVASGVNGFGGNNTFVGDVIINSGGTAGISRDVNLGAAGNQLFLNGGGTLRIEDGIDITGNGGTTSDTVLATFSTNRQINLPAGAGTIEVKNFADTNPSFDVSGSNPIVPAGGRPVSHLNTFTVDGLVTGAGALIKEGDGTLVLTNTSNDYGGGTTINAGTLSISDPAALGLNGSNFFINNNAVFQVTDNGTGLFNSARTVVLGGTGGPAGLGGGVFAVASGVNETRSGVISGSGSLSKTGSGTLTLAADNTYTGGSFLDAGVVVINSNASLGAASGATTVGNATLAVTNSINTSRNFTLSDANSTIQVATDATYTIDGTVSGTGALNKTGSGKMTLNGTNSYSGDTMISDGALNVQHATALGATAAGTTVGFGGELQLQANVFVGAEPLTLSGAGASGSGALRNIADNNSFAGALTLASAATIGADAGFLALSGVVSKGANLLTIDGAGTVSLDGAVSGSGAAGIAKDGSGTLFLTEANSYTGVTLVNAGTVAIGDAGALGSTSAVDDGTTVAFGAAVRFEDDLGLAINGELLTLSGHGIGGTGALLSAQGDNSWTGAVTLAADASVGVSTATLELSGSISESGSARALIKTGLGSLTLSAINSYTGATIVNEGSLTIGATGSLASLSIHVAAGAAFSVAAGGALPAAAALVADGAVDFYSPTRTLGSLDGATSGLVTLHGTNLSVGSGTFAGSIQNGASPGSLTKIDPGTLLLSGANTFTGATIIAGGTLTAGISGTLGGTSSIAVHHGGTLLLGGTVDRINDAAGITLGESVTHTGGTFNTAGLSETVGALTLSATSTIDFGNGASVLHFSLAGTTFATGQTLAISNWSGSPAGGGADQLIFSQDMAGYLGQISFTGFESAAEIDLGGGQFEIVAVPEPSILLSVLCSLGLLGLRRRRRPTRN